jgi:hypothetical protein
MKIDSAYFIAKYSRNSFPSVNRTPGSSRADLGADLRKRLDEISRASELQNSDSGEIERIRKLLSARETTNPVSPEGLGGNIDIKA